MQVRGVLGGVCFGSTEYGVERLFAHARRQPAGMGAGPGRWQSLGPFFGLFARRAPLF